MNMRKKTRHPIQLFLAFILIASFIAIFALGFWPMAVAFVLMLLASWMDYKMNLSKKTRQIIKSCLFFITIATFFASITLFITGYWHIGNIGIMLFYVAGWSTAIGSKISKY